MNKHILFFLLFSFSSCTSMQKNGKDFIKNLNGNNSSHIEKYNSKQFNLFRQFKYKPTRISGKVFIQRNNRHFPLQEGFVSLISNDKEIIEGKISHNGAFALVGTIPDGHYLLVVESKSHKKTKKIEVKVKGFSISGLEIILNEGIKH